MKSKNNIQIILLVCVLFLGATILSNLNLIKTNIKSTENEMQFLKTSYHYTFSSIVIDNTDPSKDWAYTAATYAWCSGGPGTNPTNSYYIEDTLFTPGFYDNGITIRNSDVYFRIKDCGVEHSSGDLYWYVYAIEFDNVSNGRVVDCTFIENDNAIYFLDSNNNWISGNFINHTNDFGFYLDNCNDCIIFNNELTDSYGWGIYIEGDNNTITQNEISYAYNNAFTLSGENNQFMSNTIYNSNMDGVVLHSCVNTTLSDNIIIGNNYGLRIDHDCVSNNITRNIVSYNTGYGIRLEDSSTNFNNVINNTVEYNTYGIELLADLNRISLNTISNNAFCGININNGAYNNITDNNLINCGVHVYGSVEYLVTNNVSDTNLVNDKKLYYYSNTDALSNSDFTDAGQVILLKCNDSHFSNLDLSFGTIGVTLFECRNVGMSNIVANHNTGFGIYLKNCDLCKVEECETVYNGDGGIVMRTSVNCTIISNEANNNFFYSFLSGHIYDFGIGDGIYAHGSFNNTIQGNTASYNYRYGIGVASGSNHEISQNYVDYNNNTGIYLTSLNHGNIFSNIIIGNYINGLHLYNCRDCKVYQNTAQNHDDQGFLAEHNGIILSESVYNELYDNSLLSYTRGIHLYSHSEYNSVFNNSFADCNTGILIYYQSHFNNLSYNTLNCKFDGIELCDASNNTIDHNDIISTQDGLRIRENSNYNLILSNSIKGGGFVGIDLYDSSYNLIKGNTIRQKRECFSEGGNCVGNIFEDNDCQESSFIDGYNLILVLSVLGVTIILLYKIRIKTKIK